MKLARSRYFVEMLSIVILIIIFIYLPERVKIHLKEIFTKSLPKSIITTHECAQVPVIKYIHPIKGELWAIEDSNCTEFNKNALIIYNQRLIGKIIEKKDNYAILIPVYNKDMKLKVKTTTKNEETVEGIFQGMGNHRGMVFLIPAALEVPIGQKVYTALDEKNNIPENLFVGFVEDEIIEQNQTVTLIVTTDFNLDALSKEKIKILSY